MSLIAIFLLVVAALGALPSLVVVRVAQRWLCSGSRPIRWMVAILPIAVWVAAAVATATYALAELRAATRPMPAVGPDWRVVFRFVVIETPLWSVLMLPSLAALAAVVAWSPAWADLMRLWDRLPAGRYRIYTCIAVALLLAALLPWVPRFRGVQLLIVTLASATALFATVAAVASRLLGAWLKSRASPWRWCLAAIAALIWVAAMIRTASISPFELYTACVPPPRLPWQDPPPGPHDIVVRTLLWATLMLPASVVLWVVLARAESVERSGASQTTGREPLPRLHRRRGFDRAGCWAARGFADHRLVTSKDEASERFWTKTFGTFAIHLRAVRAR